MDTFRRPATIVAIVALIAVVIAAVYFWRSCSLLREELSRQSERLAAVTKRLSEMPAPQHFGQMLEGLKQLAKASETGRKKMTKQEKEMESLRASLDAMTDHFAEQGIKLRLPRRSKHAHSHYESSSEEEEEPEPTPAAPVDDGDDELAARIARTRARRGATP